MNTRATFSFRTDLSEFTKKLEDMPDVNILNLDTHKEKDPNFDKKRLIVSGNIKLE